MVFSKDCIKITLSGFQFSKYLFKIFRQRTFKLQILPCRRMNKSDFGSMKTLPFDSGKCFSIDIITQNRVPQIR